MFLLQSDPFPKKCKILLSNFPITFKFVIQISLLLEIKIILNVLFCLQLFSNSYKVDDQI